MRCPYCGGLNADQARFCARCGRDIVQTPVPTQSPPPSKSLYTPNTASQRPSYVQPRPSQPMLPPGQQPPIVSPRPSQTAARSRPTVPDQAQTPSATRGKRGQQAMASDVPSSSVTVPVAEPPTTFPPRTVRQLQDLEVGALEYTILDESESYGRKKIVRIGYPRCVGWQQVATLYKAVKAYRSAQFDTIIIQGISPERADKYNYTNGMIQFDQKVRLGSQMLNRYQIETENGFSSEAIRIVLTEE
jgi:hypothetical protein